MALEYDDTTLTEAMLSAFEADKPVLWPVNELTKQDDWTSVVAAEWRESGSWDSGADITAPGFATNAAYDGFGDVPTKPIRGDGGMDPDTSTEVSLIFKFPFPGIDIDSIVIIGHNFAEFGAGTLDGEVASDRGLFVYVEAADLSSFDSATTLASAHVQLHDTTRLVWTGLDAGAPATWLNIRYLRVRIQWIDDDGAGMPFAPEIGEVFAGQRIQLSKQPDRPFDHLATVNDVATGTSKSGAVSKYVRFAGKTSIAATWQPKINGEADTLDDFASLRSWHRHTSNGTGCFLWMPRPTSLPDYAYLMQFPDSRFTMPEQEPFLAVVTLNMEEQPPFRYGEEQAPPVETPLFALYLATDDDFVEYGYVGLDLTPDFVCSFDMRASHLGNTTDTTSIHVLGSFVSNPLTHFDVVANADGSFEVFLGLPGPAPDYYAGTTMSWTSAPGLLLNNIWATIGIDYDGTRTGNDRLRVTVNGTNVESGGTYSATPPANLGSTASTGILTLGSTSTAGTTSYQLALDNFELHVGANVLTMAFEETTDPDGTSSIITTDTPSGSIGYVER